MYQYESPRKEELCQTLKIRVNRVIALLVRLNHHKTTQKGAFVNKEDKDHEDKSFK